MTTAATAPTAGPDWLVVDAAAPEPFDPAGAYRSGVRAIALDRPVDLAGPTRADLRALDVVRGATAQGLHVSWVLRALPPTLELVALSHLYPPERIDQPPADGAVDAWWDGFYLGRCCWRQGPGFVQIRDRRSGSLAKYTITEPDLTRVLCALDAGEPVVDLAVARPMVEEGLVLTWGPLAWLAPYRLVRWPIPSMGV